MIYIISIKRLNNYSKVDKMEYSEMMESWINGNKKDVVYEIKHNFGFYEFSSELENDGNFTAEEKVEIFASVLRIAF